jgi:hypothetical protein
MVYVKNTRVGNKNTRVDNKNTTVGNTNTLHDKKIKSVDNKN